MARSATVKINADKGGFSSGIKQSTDEVLAMQKKIADFDAERVRQVKALRDEYAKLNKDALAPTAGAVAFSAAIKGAQYQAASLFSTIKNGMRSLTGIGGAMGTVELIRAGMKTEQVYRDVAFAMRAGTGEAVNMRDLMDEGAKTAQKWGKDVDELGRAMHTVWSQTGDKDFTRKSLDTIAMISRASGESVDTLANLSGGLRKHFGVTNEELGDTLGAVLSLGNKGGVSVEELSSRVGFLGSAANTAGMKGKEGFGVIAGMLNFGAEGAKNFRKNLTTVQKLIEDMENQPKRLKMMMQLGVSETDIAKSGGNFQDSMAAMLKATGGKKDKLAVAFKNESELQFMADLGEHYAKAFDATKGDIKTKMAAGVAEFKRQLSDSGKAAIDRGAMEKIAAENMKTSQAKMDAAMQKMRAAFLRPEVTSAMEKLADVLPIVAEHFAKLVGFVAEHPVAGAGYLAGRQILGGGASAGLASLLKSAISGGGGAAGQAAAAGMAAGAPGAGQAFATAAGGGMLAGVPVWGAALAAAVGVGLAGWQAKGLQDQAVQDVVNDKGETVDKTTGEGAWRNIRTELRHSKLFNTLSAALPAGSLGLFGGDMSEMSDEDYKQELDERAGIVSDTGDNTSGMSYDAWAKAHGISTAANPYKLKQDVIDAAAPTPAVTHAPSRSREDAALLAEMLAAKTLPVKIVNPEALRVGGGGGAGGLGSPGPGYSGGE